MITVVLNVYKRLNSLETQIRRIKEQSVKPKKIFIWNNFIFFLYFAKFIWTCKIFFSPYKIKDPHGLNSYPTMVVEQSFQLMTSHENHILPIALALKNGLMVVNVPVEVRREHKREGNRKNVPKITDVLDSINNLLLARKILKNKN